MSLFWIVMSNGERFERREGCMENMKNEIGFEFDCFGFVGSILCEVVKFQKIRFTQFIDKTE